MYVFNYAHINMSMYLYIHTSLWVCTIQLLGGGIASTLPTYSPTYPLSQVIAAWDLLQLPVSAADYWEAGRPKARQDDKAHTTALVERAAAWKRDQQQSDENCSSSDETVGGAASSRPSSQKGIDLASDGATADEYCSAVGDGRGIDVVTQNSPRGSHQSVPVGSREQSLRNSPRNGPKNEVDSASSPTGAKRDMDSIVGDREMEHSGDEPNR